MQVVGYVINELVWVYSVSKKYAVNTNRTKVNEKRILKCENKTHSGTVKPCENREYIKSGANI